jgi:hypothetical protein
MINKKKVRGWKRQIRKLEQWKQNHLHLSLNRYGYDYVKIWLDPFYRLQQRNPPVWFRRLIVAALIEIYDSWHKQLISLGEPFYLKIWFFEPHFIQSQVVAATGERIEYYENLFMPDTKSRKFPFEKYAHGNYDLSAFDWQLHVDEDFYFEQADELTAEDLYRLKKKAFRVETTEDGDTMLIIKKGNMFVGEHTSNKSSNKSM